MGFQMGDTFGILKGKTVKGALFQGSDSVAIIIVSYPSRDSDFITDNEP